MTSAHMGFYWFSEEKRHSAERLLAAELGISHDELATLDWSISLLQGTEGEPIAFMVEFSASPAASASLRARLEMLGGYIFLDPEFPQRVGAKAPLNGGGQ